MKRIVSILLGVMVCAPIVPVSNAVAQNRGQAAQVQGSVSTPDESARRAAELAELEAWLPRLTGRFRIEARMRRGPAFVCGNHPMCTGAPIGDFIPEVALSSSSFIYAIGRSATGIGDCVEIGAGPGVHCVFNVPWPEFVETEPKSGRPIVLPWKDRTLDPAIFLFGMDPDNSGIRYLTVDGQSIAEEAWGYLKGDTVHFKLPCGMGHDSYGRFCDRKFWIRAPGGDEPVQVHLEVREISPSYPMVGPIRLAEYDLTLHRVGQEGR
jgi:hypothetical protein